MSGMGRALARSGDLALAVLLAGVLVGLMAADSSLPLVGPARLVVGFIVVLFLPGYCLLAVLAARPRSLDRAERLGISIGVSIALIPIIALLLDALPSRIRPWPVVISEASFITICAVLAVWNRGRIADNTPTSGTLRAATGGWLRQLSWPERIMYPLVLVTIVVAGGAALAAQLTPNHEDLMTEMYVLGRSNLAEQFPRLVGVSEPVSVTMGVVNHEGTDRTYRFEAWARDAWHPEQRVQVVPPMTLSLEPDERQEWPLTWVMRQPGEDQIVDLLLFVGQEQEPYRRLQLWLDVQPAAVAGGEVNGASAANGAASGIDADLAPPAAGSAAPTPAPALDEHLQPVVPAPVGEGIVPQAPAAVGNQLIPRGKIASAAGPTAAPTVAGLIAAAPIAATGAPTVAATAAPAAPTTVPTVAPTSVPTNAALPVSATPAVVSVAPTAAPTEVPPPPTAALPAAAASAPQAGGAAVSGSRVLPGYQTWWVKNHRPTQLETGLPGQTSAPGTMTTAQFCSFLVINPQVNDELLILNPHSGTVQRVQASDVGPVEGPLIGRGAQPTDGTCNEVIYPPTQAIIDEPAFDGHNWTVTPQSAVDSTGGVSLQAPPGDMVTLWAPLVRPLVDAMVSVTVDISRAPTQGRFGVFLRAGTSPDGLDSFYGLWVDASGQAGIMRRDGDMWQDRESPRQLPASALSDGKLELVTAALGNTLVLVVDGTPVVAVPDARPRAGGLGLFADGVDGEVRLERVLVEEIVGGCWATGGDPRQPLRC
ncbi:MAG: DUF1616 domain-containing protein [Chloroflexota bacterium]